MWDFIYAEHRLCAAIFFFLFFIFHSQQRRTRLAFRGVLFSFCARITKRNVDARTETHYAACIFINGSASLYVRAFLAAAVWKRRCWREARARCTFIILSAIASRGRSRIYGESITRKSIASRWRWLHRYLANEISRNSDVCANAMRPSIDTQTQRFINA